MSYNLLDSYPQIISEVDWAWGHLRPGHIVPYSLELQPHTYQESKQFGHHWCLSDVFSGSWIRSRVSGTLIDTLTWNVSILSGSLTYWTTTPMPFGIVSNSSFLIFLPDKTVIHSVTLCKLLWSIWDHIHRKKCLEIKFYGKCRGWNKGEL